MEASGTSGMKAALNGVPSLSILDGWWIEGLHRGHHRLGHRCATRLRTTRPRTPRAGMPLRSTTSWSRSSSRSSTGNRDQFIEIMRHAIALNGSFFNTQRMILQYVQRAYFE